MPRNQWRDLVVWWRSGMPPCGPTVSGKDAERLEQAMARNEQETVPQEEWDRAMRTYSDVLERSKL